ncbi:hypothetical protein ABZT47_14510 [Sphaerisporangium sp. NPDC005289]|uniref:hypothetical protein n=1 Tax=Sphaerisporangium sp. NPDC005289 TaxID=3155247 RepID=UPI0033AD6832
MPDGESIAGYRLTGRSRAGETGTWTDAVTPDGGRGGVLWIDPGVLVDPGARDRVVAEVTADRRLTRGGVAGLVPITDLVAARGQVWLLTARPGTPSLAELMRATASGPVPDAGSAATILVETAQTLLAVHSAGLVHGALHAGTVVIAEDGTALLAERGLVPALRGAHASVERDLAAWASLARGLAAAWAAGDQQAARLFDRAAATATTHGLGAARDALVNGRDLLPSGFATRERLVQTIQWWSASAVPTGQPPHLPPSPQGVDTGEVVTLLYVPAGAGERPAHPAAETGQAPPAATTPAGGEMRFGPGVPADTTAAQIWRAGREQPTVAAAERLAAPRRRRRRRGGFVGSAVLFALILLAAAFLWFQRGAPLSVTAVQVKQPKAAGCDTTVNVVGVLTTNGSAGQVSYEWLLSKQKPIKHTDAVPSGRSSHEVTLEWDVSGHGTRKLTARLRVLSPVGASGAPIEDAATFTYKC